MTKKLIGSIFTDVASLIIGDPCKLIGEGCDIIYQDFLDRTIPEKDAITVNTMNCDGWCYVYGLYNDDGDMIEVIIDLSPKIKPGR